jgi:hypothetical protein
MLSQADPVIAHLKLQAVPVSLRELNRDRPTALVGESMLHRIRHQFVNHESEGHGMIEINEGRTTLDS